MALVPTEEGTCEICQQKKVITSVTLRKVSGFIIFDTFKTYRVQACAECIKKLYGECQKHNLLRGWWGIRAFLFYNPINLVMNFSRSNKALAKIKNFERKNT